MNALDALSAGGLLDRGFCCRLTLTLLHFLWQGAAVGALGAAAAYALRKRPSHLRYGLHLASLLLMAACVPATYLMVNLPETPVVEAPRPAPQPAAGSTWAEVPVDSDRVPFEADATFAPPRPFEPYASEGPAPSVETAAPATEMIDSEVAAAAHGFGAERLVESAAPYATAAYLAGVMAMALRLAMALWGGHRLIASAAPVREPALLDMIGRQARQLGLKAVPLVAWCGRIATPVAVGILRPAVLLPASLIGGLAPEQLAALVTHELAHVRRYDVAVSLVQRIVEAMLFFHPAVWYVSRRMSRERENCCDDLVVRAGWRRIDYAEALLKTAEMSSARRIQAAALGASAGRPSELKRRILRLVAAPEPPLRLSRAGATAVATGLAIAVLLAIHAGVTAQTSPEVAAPELSATGAAPEEPAEDPAASGASGAASADPAAADSGPTAAHRSPVKDLAELIRRVRRNEALLEDLDVTVRTVSEFAVPASAQTGVVEEGREADPAGGLSRRVEEEVYRAVTDHGRLHFSGEDVTSLASGQKLRGKQISVFDGDRTVSIEEGNCVTVHQGRHEPGRLVPPHCWGLSQLRTFLQVNFPLSVYLQGTEAMKSHPKVRRLPGEEGFDYEFHKVESQVVGEEVIDGLACVKVRVRMASRGSDPLAVQDLWLAKDRNYHVARCRTALCDKDQEVPDAESRVVQWRELAKGVWLPALVEEKDISPDRAKQRSSGRRLVLQQAAWRPNPRAGFFKLPEVPAGLPKYVIGAGGGLVDSPRHPATVKAAAPTTLQAIIKRLAEEEKRYRRLEVVSTARYQMLNRSDVGPSGACLPSITRERSVAAGDRLYYQEECEWTAPGGGTSHSARQAFDGRWLRALDRFVASRGPGQKPEVQAMLRLNGAEEARLLRAHNVVFYHDRNPQSIAEYLASGWFDKINRNRMTVEYVGDETVGDLYCHKLKCELPHKWSKGPYNALFVWLARDRNLLPVRQEWREPAWSRKLPTSVGFAWDLREIRPGLWFPMRATHLAHRKNGRDSLAAGQIVLQWRTDIQIEAVTVDPKVDEKLFAEIEVPAGTPIWVQDEDGQEVARLKQPKTGNLELSLEEFRALRRKAAANEDDEEDPADPTVPERTRRIDAALKVLRRKPPATREERIEASLEILRNYRVFKTNAKKWGLALRVLIQTGKPAVPKLIWELDHVDHLANRGHELRALGYVLRGIGDPRAVPALVRALPRTLQPLYSDCGMGIPFDRDLLAFLQRHDHDQTDGGDSFSYGRPINEVLPALRKLTGQPGIVPGPKENPDFKDIRGVFLGGSPKEVRKKQVLFLRFAQQWADWWSKHWKAHVKDEAEAQLDQTRSALDRAAKAISGSSDSQSPRRTSGGA